MNFSYTQHPLITDKRGCCGFKETNYNFGKYILGFIKRYCIYIFNKLKRNFVYQGFF